jgi:hypothetical protein
MTETEHKSTVDFFLEQRCLLNRKRKVVIIKLSYLEENEAINLKLRGEISAERKLLDKIDASLDEIGKTLHMLKLYKRRT